MPSHSRARPTDPDSVLVAEVFGADPEALVEALRLAPDCHGRFTGAIVDAGAQNANDGTFGALDRVAKIPEYKVCAGRVKAVACGRPMTRPAPGAGGAFRLLPR